MLNCANLISAGIFDISRYFSFWNSDGMFSRFMRFKEGAIFAVGSAKKLLMNIFFYISFAFDLFS